jgi:hypothetical protein
MDGTSGGVLAYGYLGNTTSGFNSLTVDPGTGSIYGCGNYYPGTTITTPSPGGWTIPNGNDSDGFLAKLTCGP